MDGGGLNDWVEYRRLILSELQRLNDSFGEFDKKLNLFKDSITVRIDVLRSDDIAKLRVEVAMLQVKAGVWGLVAGLIPGLITAMYVFLSRK
jgi:hypothetical protein